MEKCFGLPKRKRNISRNNHFAAIYIVGASIGPCQHQVMISFTSVFYPLDTTVCCQFAVLFLSECCSYFWEKTTCELLPCVMLCGERRCYYYCLTDINHFEIVGFQMEFYAFLHRKRINKNVCIIRRGFDGFLLC